MAAMSVATRCASVAFDFFIGNGFYLKIDVSYMETPKFYIMSP